jgi:hypothetical protein
MHRIKKRLCLALPLPNSAACLDGHGFQHDPGHCISRAVDLGNATDGSLAGGNLGHVRFMMYQSCVCTAPHFPGPPGGVIHGTETRRT